MGQRMLEVCLFLLFIWVFTSVKASGEGEKDQCTVNIPIDPSANATYTFFSPGYPNDSYTPGLLHTWCFSSPSNTTVTLLCDQLDIPKSPECEINGLVVSSSEDEPRSYCGTNQFQAKSSSNDMKIKLHSSKKSRGGKFHCQVLAEEPENYNLRAIVYEGCDCGYSYRMRIVGGSETGINEYPFMAGIVDSRRSGIMCGAAIISERYVLTADHCLTNLILGQTGVVVGEHNVSTGSETSVTRLIKAKRFVHYPYFNSNNNQYDIALIELMSPVTYSTRVGPVCLPFMSRNWDLTNQPVTVLGWGTTEFGGPRSKVLQKAGLDIINISNCQNAYGSDIEPYTQLCTYRRNSDACQYDSGGPLCFFNSYTNRWEIVGLVSYGRGCASGTPSVNTKVAPFLQWIMDNTQSETYCNKS